MIRTQETLEVTPEEQKKAAAAQQAATAEEQRINSQLRGLQVLMQKEEQALAQRLAYAAQVRAQGLQKNDQKLLDQAELLERQALDYYLKRVKQFENYSIAPGQSTEFDQPHASAHPATRQPTPATRQPSASSSSRSPSRYSTRR